MEYFWIVAQQVLVMFLLMLVGMAVYRCGILDDEGARQLSGLLLKITTPAVIITSFQRTFDPVVLRQLGYTFLLAAGTYVLVVLMASLRFRKRQPDYRDARMCMVFSNNGFMALPLLEALLGAPGVFLGSAHIVLGSMLLWTYGQFTLTGDRKSISPKLIVTNPGTIGVLVGLLVFLSPVKLPGPVFDTVQAVGSLNTPLAMIVCGIFLCQAGIFSSFRSPAAYRMCFWRLIAAPAATLLFLLLIPAPFETRMALMIASSCPTATATVMFSRMFGSNGTYCSNNFTLTTLLSMLSIPLILSVCRLIFA